MFKRSLSWSILVFTLLEFVVRTQLTAYDNSHGFISNNHDRYLANELSSMQEELASDIRSATIQKFHIKMQLKFDPEFLDFKQRPLGVPHLEKVTLFNIDRNRSIDMTSISSNTLHFHSSFFENKKIPPLGNTSFNVVFLGREEGFVESNLYIHTSEGHLKYHVKGASVYSPYRLRPIVGVKLPLNTSFTPVIHLYNPHMEPIQIVEIYSSGGDFHLELPTGELEASKEIWEIPPLQTKAIIKVRFFARTEQNHTAYVRIKLNNTDVLIVPFEVEVTSNALLYASKGYVDFGVGGSLDAPKEIKIKLNNPLKKPIKIQSITSTSKAIKIEYTNVKNTKGDYDLLGIAKLKLNWKTAFENKDYSGKIIIQYKNSKILTEIPYFVTVVEGGLTLNASSTRYFISDKLEKINNRKITVKNDFLTSILLINVTLQEEAKKFFHVSDFTPKILKRDEEKIIFTLKLNEGVNLDELKVNARIIVNTNISTFEFPLISYNGKFDMKFPFKSRDNSLDLGLVSVDSVKDCYMLLINKNPVTIGIKKLITSLSASSVEIVGCGKGNYKHALLQDSYNVTTCEHVKSGEHAILKLTVKAGHLETQIWGDIGVQTAYEQLSIPVHFRVAFGKLEIGPDRLVFDQCFPGKICSHPLRVHSTYNNPMTIVDIMSIPPDVRISSKHTGLIVARASKIIGHLYLDPNAECQNECYLGLHDENKANWLKTLSLSKAAYEFDLNLVNILYNRYLNLTSNGLTKWQNLTMRVDTTEVKGHLFKTRVKMSWPSLIVDRTFENKSIFQFPLTQVGNVSYVNVTIKNPSSHNLIVQMVFDRHYPSYDVLFEGLPPIFLPVHAEPLEKTKHGFFIDKTPVELFDSLASVHESSLPLRLKPNENYTFRIGFKAYDAALNSGFLFLRNNLTVLEILHLRGKGALPNFKFGNRKPGSSQALMFELTEKHLKDCESEKSKKYITPTLTVKRSFTARNTGDVPVYINGFFIDTINCEGYGFKILNCEPTILPPNGTKKIDIAFSPDFTLSRITRTLILDTSLNYPVNYTLVTTVPPFYLTLCTNILVRPPWEYYYYYVCVAAMLLLLAFVSIAPLLDSDKIVRDSIEVIPRQDQTQHPLDLRLIGAQIRTEIHSSKNDPDLEQKTSFLATEEIDEENSSKQDGEKYTAVIPTTGKGRKKYAKKACDGIENETRKKNWIEAHKQVKHEETKPPSPQAETENATKKNVKKSPPLTKKVESKLIEVPVYEEETSSTTTESSNNEELDKNARYLKKPLVKPTENKPSPEQEVTHIKFERKRPVMKKPRDLKQDKIEQAQQQRTNVENKGRNNKRDRKDRLSSNKKQYAEKSTKTNDSPVNVNSSTRLSPSQQTSNIWAENKASFSDVVARNETQVTPPAAAATPAAASAAPKPFTQVQTVKPTMYVEPYKQTNVELGPIGSRKHESWQENAIPNPSPPVAVPDEYNSFFTNAHHLAMESTNAFLDLPPAENWQRNSTSPILNYIQGNTIGPQVHMPPLQADAWNFTQPRNVTWDNPTYNAPSTATDELTNAPINNPSSYLWGSSVWEPLPTAELPRTPTRTPPGFAPHKEDEERRPTPTVPQPLQQHQQPQLQPQQQQQPQQNYNPFGITTIWQRNPWNYPQ